MKTLSLIKVLIKHKLIVIKKDIYYTNYLTGEKSICKPEYFCAGKIYKVHWYDHEGDVIGALIQKLEDYNDSQSDWFPGYFANTIKDIVNDLTKE